MLKISSGLWIPGAITVCGEHALINALVALAEDTDADGIRSQVCNLTYIAYLVPHAAHGSARHVVQGTSSVVSGVPLRARVWIG